jgi:hypothetical protein
MDPHFDEQIECIMSNFDFNKVRRVMIGLGWTWNDKPFSPSVEELQKTAIRLLSSITDCAIGSTFIRSGGFCATRRGAELRLAFEIEHYDGSEITMLLPEPHKLLVTWRVEHWRWYRICDLNISWQRGKD